MASAKQSIEYFYAAHSAFAYLGSKVLNDLAREHRATIIHYPMDLHLVMQKAGSTRFSDRSKAHVRYFFGTEIDRWAKSRNLPWLGRVPTHHHKSYTLANQFLVAAAHRGFDMDQLSHALLRAHWAQDIDLTDAKALEKVANAMDIDGHALLKHAHSDEVNNLLRQNTELAIERAVLGSPTYFVAGEMFYGQDRLDFVGQALAKGADGPR